MKIPPTRWVEGGLFLGSGRTSLSGGWGYKYRAPVPSRQTVGVV